ncbi:CTP-dependent diacylglycerol kinase 1 [Metarhizium anisopliae]|nr:CTP-dependent diacylglycerol kinase 1 [Metarhizium anisopliae]
MALAGDGKPVGPVWSGVGDAPSAASLDFTLDPIESASFPQQGPSTLHSQSAVVAPIQGSEPAPTSLARRSRLDKYTDSSLHSSAAAAAAAASPAAAAGPAQQHLWPSHHVSLHRVVVGAVRSPALPPVSFTMSLRRKAASSVPETPRVISPSPDPPEHDAGYSAPTTRSAARRRMASSQHSQDEHPQQDDVDDEVPGLRRSRTRSRSPIDSRTMARMTPSNSSLAMKPLSKEPSEKVFTNGKISTSNGHLAPPQPATPSGWSWRDFSRSPSPLGLIPIHRHWRTFVHKHEVPRKALHVSIGFFVVWLYTTGTQTQAVPPYLMAGLIPIATTDWLRHRYAAVNRLYVRLLGALMRESEYSGYNGVIFYLLGAWAVLYFLPKDVGVMSVLLLSWCDTAASTFGRLWGRHTPRIRRGKSLAGSFAAFLVGVATSFFFYGWLVPVIGPMPGDENFMFKGTLSLPAAVASALGVSRAAATVSGTLALSIMGLWSGFVASASEVIDIFGWDDNFTIPVLSGIGIWGFLRLFT